MPKLIPFPRMIEPRKAVLVLRYPIVSAAIPNAVADPQQRRKEDVGQRDDAPVVERDDQQDGHRADQRDPLDVRLQRVVLRDGADHVARDLRRDRAEAGRAGLVDHPLHVVADLKPGEVARAGRLGPGDDGQQRPVFALVVAVRKRRRAAAALDVPLQPPEIRRRIVLLLAELGVGEGDEGRILPGDEQLLEIVVGPPQIAEVGVEELVPLVERSGGVRRERRWPAGRARGAAAGWRPARRRTARWRAGRAPPPR